MPFSPGGVFTPLIAFQDDTPATAEDQNSQDNDIASGLTDCLTRNGLAPPTTNLPMGGFILTGLGAGANPNDSVRFAQLQAALSALTPSGSLISYAERNCSHGLFAVQWRADLANDLRGALYCDWRGVGRWRRCLQPFAILFPISGAFLPGGGGGLAGWCRQHGRRCGRPLVWLFSCGYRRRASPHLLVTRRDSFTGTHTDSGSCTHTDAGHTHQAYFAQNNPGTATGGGSISRIIASGGSFVTGSFGTYATSIQSCTWPNIQNTGGGGVHNNVQPTAAVNWLIKT